MRADGSFDEAKREEMHNSISCYRQAIKLCHASQVPVLQHELASVLERMAEWSEAGCCFLEAGSFRRATAAFVEAGDLFAAVAACERSPESHRTNDDLVLSFLLKLSSNQVHVLKPIEQVSDDRRWCKRKWPGVSREKE